MVKPFPRAFAALLLPALLALAAGCGNYMLWEYRDDPYLAAGGAKSEGEVLRGVNAADRNERQIALRLVAQRAGEARRRGDQATADRLDDIVIRRYFVERDTAVRACVVRLCAPASGRGSRKMVEFLRGRIAAGEFPGYAALSLAYLAPRTAFQDIEPLTRHPDPAVRYEAASALVALGDPRGFSPVATVWRGMGRPNWPDRVDGMNLEEARENLARQAARSFGRPLF